MREGTTATYVLLGVIVTVFLAVTAVAELLLGNHPRGDEAYAMVVVLGAKNNAAIDQGQFWRFGTHMLLHGNLLHLVVNGYALFVLGKILEKLYGLRRFLVVFFFSGFCGGLASYLFTSSNSVGASGAIFGLLGAAVVFGAKNRGILPARIGRLLTVGLLPWVAINLFIGVAIENIDNAAHVGGLIGGSLIALTMGTRLRLDKSSVGFFAQWAFVALSVGFLIYSVISFVAEGFRCGENHLVFWLCIEELIPR